MSDIEIARKADKKNIRDVAKKLNLKEDHLKPYGHHIAKIDINKINKNQKKRFKINFSYSYFTYSSWRGKNNNLSRAS